VEYDESFHPGEIGKPKAFHRAGGAGERTKARKKKGPLARSASAELETQRTRRIMGHGFAQIDTDAGGRSKPAWEQQAGKPSKLAFQLTPPHASCCRTQPGSQAVLSGKKCLDRIYRVLLG